jgi:1-acyl-sn-glycerol-3-phosphate acyltransferase
MIWLRSAAFLVFFYLATLALLVPANLLVVFRPDRTPAIARCWARVTLWGARVLCGIHWRLEGAANLPPGPVLIAARHESAFDTLVWLQVAPRCVYVLKFELTRIPLLGPVLIAAGNIAVRRSAGAGALRRMLVDVGTALAADRQVVIFPEGTRVPHDAPVVLQSGIALLAERVGVPVVPATTDSGLRWARRAFLKRPGLIRVVIRPPLPAGLPRADLLAALVRDLRLEPVDKSVG